jgi:hypothetical protein
MLFFIPAGFNGCKAPAQRVTGKKYFELFKFLVFF